MPYKPGEREYRTFSNTFEPVVSEEAGSAPYTVEGYATTFDRAYDFGPDCRERVMRSAVEGADLSDVIFQLNHEGQTLARQKNGSLELSVDDHGLKVRASLGGSQQGRDLYEAISNGLIDKMSWGFTVPADGWEWDEQTRTSTITRVGKVYDVSAVSIPADQDTEIFARSYLHGEMERARRESAERDRELRQRAALRIRLL